MTTPDSITVRLTVDGKPELLDWLGRKVLVTPRTVEFTYRPGQHTGPFSADVTGPARSAPRIQPFRGEMTITFYHQYPEHWPQWLRDLGNANAPRT